MDHAGETVPGREPKRSKRSRIGRGIAKGVVYSVLAVAFGLAVRAIVRATRRRKSA